MQLFDMSLGMIILMGICIPVVPLLTCYLGYKALKFIMRCIRNILSTWYKRMEMIDNLLERSTRDVSNEK